MHRLLVLVVAIATALTGCAGAPHHASPVSGVSLPPGITVDVYQTRTDLPARGLQIAVTNASGAVLVVTAAELRSSQFAAPAAWRPRPGGTSVRPGTSVDLPVHLPAPSCADPDPIASVRIEFATADGRTGEAVLPAIDRYGRLGPMREEECRAASIAEVVSLRIDTPVRFPDPGEPIAFVRIAFHPTGAPGAVTLDGVEDTVLLALADGRGGTVDALPIGLRIDAAVAPGTVEFPIAPARCDPHAVAEDKQGTVFVLAVTAPDGVQGTIRIAATPTARASIYDFIAAACGLPQ